MTAKFSWSGGGRGGNGKMANMTWLLALILFFKPQVVRANPFVDQIHKYCAQGSPASEGNELSRILDKLQDDFKGLDARANNPMAYVAALDDAIAHSGSAAIPRCRETLRQAGFAYRIDFENPAAGCQVMFVTDDDNKTVTLHFNLNKSVQRALFTYLHEMVHVCQTAERLAQSNEGDITRFQMFGEVQAFYSMIAAYRELLPLSPRLCRDEDLACSSNAVLSEAYISSELQIERGDFAQSIVNNYSVNFDQQRKSYLFAMPGPLHSYPANYLEPAFNLRALDPRFMELLKRLPIPVVEP